LSIAIIFFAWLAYRYLPRAYRFLKTRRELHRRSEAAYFRNLIRACRRNDAGQAYQELLRWQTRSGRARTLDQFLEQANDEALTQQVNSLSATLFSSAPKGTWTGRTMANLLEKHRKVLSTRSQRCSKLPLLNP
jgi:hypothetical protein